jgi:MarR family transcriptional regulator, organic hydroperoxide resistance regulator
MQIEEAILRVQMAYPRVYLACHSRHQNKRTTAVQLSQRDATLLAHLSETDPVSQNDLASHVGIGKSTLSEAVSALQEAGYVVRNGAVLRTAAGTQAMSSSSVLEGALLRDLLLTLNDEERSRAVEGLELLATGARRVAGGKRRKD